MPSFGTRPFLLIGLLLGSAFGMAQVLNLEHDLLGKPYLPEVVVSEVEGYENTPWLKRGEFEGSFMKALKGIPGMGNAIKEKNLKVTRSPYNKNPYYKRLMGGKHYLLKTYIDGGAVVHSNNGNEILKFISFQVSIVNIATSEVEAVYRFECNSERFFQRTKERNVKYPKVNILERSMLESVKESMIKKMGPFFYHLETIAEFRLDAKAKKDRGVIIDWKGSGAKDIAFRGYVLALSKEVPSSRGLIRTFISLGAVKYSVNKTTIGKPFYEVISGRGRVQKALDRGMDIFIYPTNTVE